MLERMYCVTLWKKKLPASVRERLQGHAALVHFARLDKVVCNAMEVDSPTAQTRHDDFCRMADVGVLVRVVMVRRGLSPKGLVLAQKKTSGPL